MTIQIDDLWFALFASEEKVVTFCFACSLCFFFSLLTTFCISIVQLVDALIRRYIYPGNKQPSDQEVK